jgi:hypothetical protein
MDLRKAILGTAFAAGAAIAFTPSPGVEMTYQKIYDADLSVPGTSMTLTADKNWYLADLFVVDSGCVLNIEAGTWIFGAPAGRASNERAGALIVAPGGKINALGTAEAPIVMTAFGDDPRDPLAMGPGVKGMWGGVILCGRAPVSTMRTGVLPYPEGIPTGDARLYYGGTNSSDNSGIMTYVSIRHGGSSVASNSEVNGLTPCGVGSGTTLDYIEVYANMDDGWEPFGGTVNIKHFCSFFNNDDGFDGDDGWVGKAQFLFNIHNSWVGARCVEMDGCQPGDAFASNPTMANVTILGSGQNSLNTADDQNFGNGYALAFADSLKGNYTNWIVMDAPRYAVKRWVHKNGLPGSYGPGGMNCKSFIFWAFGNVAAYPGTATVWDSIVRPISDIPYFTNAANRMLYVDPQLRGISREVGLAALDPRPAIGSPALDVANVAPTPVDPFFTSAPYIGAFNGTDLWCDKWTAASQQGILSGLLSVTPFKTEMQANQLFDLGMELKVPGAVPIGGVITLDGADITSIVLPLLSITPMADGGTMIKIPSIPASILGSTAYPATHTFGARLNLSTGATVSGSTVIKIAR